MKQIFPLGSPETFEPFHPERCLYKIVETPHECVSSNAVVPTTSTIELEAPLTTEPPLTAAAMEVPVTDLVTAAEPVGVDEQKRQKKKKKAIKGKSKGCC